MKTRDIAVIITAVLVFVYLVTKLQSPASNTSSLFQGIEEPPLPPLDALIDDPPNYNFSPITDPTLPGIGYISSPALDLSSLQYLGNPSGSPAPYNGGGILTQLSTPGLNSQAPTFNPPQPALANEQVWIQGQMQQTQYPNATLTRTPVALNSQNATGTWGLRGYFPALVNYVSFASGSEPAPNYTGNVGLSLQHPLASGQSCQLYALTDQGYPQNQTSGSGDFYNFNTFPGNRYVGCIFDEQLGIIASTECLFRSFDPTYKVNSAVITDQAYYQYPTPLLSDGSYQTLLLLDYVSFNLSSPETTSNPQLLSQSFTAGPYESQLVPYSFVPSPPQQIPPTLYAQTFILQGLVKSFLIPVADPAYPFLHDRTYTYDEALTIISWLGTNQDLCEQSVLALCQIQSTVSGQVGWWYFDVDSTTGAPADPYFRVGAAAWCVYALCLYCITYPGGNYVTNAKSAIGTGISAIQAFQSSVGSPQGGLVQLGYGEYVGNDFIPGNQSSASCEHNVDYWFALNAANVVFPGTYAAAATTIKSALISKLWGQNIYGLPVFTEGIAADGTLDTADALDINSWGGLWWLAQTDSDAAANAALCLSNAQAFYCFPLGFISGYAPYLPNRGYPGTIPNVWSEGTQGVSLLQYRLSQTKNSWATIDNMIYIRLSSGGWEYAFLQDTINQLQTWPGISGTAWAVFNLVPQLQALVYKGYN